MIHTRQGNSHPSSFMVEGQQHQPAMAIIMSLQYVQTKAAANRIYEAEMKGLSRPEVIAQALRRLDDFTRPRIPRIDARSEEN